MLHGPWTACNLADHPGQACTILQEKGLAAGAAVIHDSWIPSFRWLSGVQNTQLMVL